ncbi:PAS domain S-box protein [Chelatococcus sp. SYSU_G07232]|uniref:histidine kinase n=1 Tax=Chelatococcus albus TaxID=3047466 RepID=A0ABT7AH28_9HYPH|nr:PAS domain S-box protein [Chelatococcus sp. SYSU_G07232]MDJ1157946.1 PAS domain S-box protein [Chelatococcus sp. SYSU_G07232]
MTPSAPDLREDLAALRQDASLASFLTPQAATVLWSPEGRALWASDAAAPFVARVMAAPERSFVRERIAKLAAGLAPFTGLRLERLRIAAGTRVDLLTCACRLVHLRAGGLALMTSIVGGQPKDWASTSSAPIAVPTPAAGDAASPALDPAEAVRALAARRATVRFLWEMDAEGVFTRVSPELADVVGREPAGIIGYKWEDIEGDFAFDPEGAVERALAKRDTWSGRTVLWRIGETRLRVPVELAAIPLHDRDRRFTGFRGFGLCRLDSLTEEPVEDGEEGEPQAGVDILTPISAESAPDAAAGVTDVPAPEPRSYAATDIAEPTLAGPGEAGIGEIGAEEGVTPLQTGARPVQPPDEARDAAAAPADRASRAEPPPSGPFPPVRGAVAATLGAPKVVPLRVVEVRGEAPGPERGRTPAGPDAARPPASGVGDGRPELSSSERNAFREIARALGARLADEESRPRAAEAVDAPQRTEAAPVAEPVVIPFAPPFVPAAPPASNDTGGQRPSGDAFASLADRLPIGILISRDGTPVYANRTLLDLLGFVDLAALAAAGGLDALFEGGAISAEQAPVVLRAADGETIPVEARLAAIDWQGSAATLMCFRRALGAAEQQDALSLHRALEAQIARSRELTEILDTATDGVIVLDERGRIVSLNRSAEALFGYDEKEVAGEAFTLLLAPESHAVAFDYLEGLKAGGVASVLNDGREVTGRVRQGGKCPLTMTIGRIGDASARKFCAVLRDMTAAKKAEAELLAAKKAAEEASAQKSDFLAKMSHEIRTPLNAIIGFAEVMLEERFGPLANERYKEYLADIHASGGHVISLVNDLLDLAKIEAGRMDLSFTSVNLNEIVSNCVALMQPQANRDRIVLRTSLAAKLPPVVADERSMRQIVLNVLSNAVKFTDAGGQVIVSTALTDRGEVALRIRDTGIGMTDKEVEAALEPFRQLATARRPGGTGLGLPLTKALVEANRGSLVITSAKREGTLVEIVLPPTRVLAE